MTIAPAAQPTTPYRLEADEVAAGLGSDAGRGLAEAEASACLERYGRNELEHEPPVPAWRRFLAQFRDTLTLLLLAATAVSIGLWVYERDAALPYEGLVIFGIVLLNAVLGFAQETRAERAVAALRDLAAPQATVVRDGERRRIPAAELVPGDLVLIEEGDTIPADARVVEATALQTAEASLTGESLPVTKQPVPLPDETDLADRTNMLFAGTVATAGRGRALVTATGMGTEIGKIAGLLRQTESEKTPLQRELDRTGRLLGGVVLAIAAAIVAVILLVEGVDDVAAFVDVLVLGVALAVAAVPEGLSAVTTATLALGMQRMARRNAIVRKLPAVETLGSATVIASDKTGTLTRNEMTVRVVVTASGRVDVGGTGYAPDGDLRVGDAPLADGPLRAEVTRTLRGADLASNATLQERDGRWAILGDPTEGALIVAARKAGLSEEDLAGRFKRVGEVPFSSERKLMSVVDRDARRPDRPALFVKGAPDVLLGRCGHELVGEEARPLTDERRAAILAVSDQLAGEALRTLGVAFSRLPEGALAGPVDEGVERDLVFLGQVGMIDPPRAEARDAVAVARRAGIRPMMITGDHPRTAAAIAGELGIDVGAGAISGGTLERLSDDQLRETVRVSSVYARVAPEHKLRIVGALRRDGHVVAMTGDGVNDAPALRAADIGVAMGIAGTDVSKEAADMVLADDNFATIVAAVEEGRGIFANVQKFLRYLLSSNVGEVATMFFGVLLADTLGLVAEAGAAVVTPLLATQILWINLVTDGPPALALGLDPTDPDLMRHPPRRQGSGAITPQTWRGILFVGLVMAAGTLLVFDRSLPGGLLSGEGDLPYARTMAFTTLVLFQLFNVFNARSDTRSAFAGLATNRWLWGAVVLSLALHALVVYAPFLQNAFGTVPLSAADWLLCLAVASSVLWLREAAKVVERRLAPA
jgi:Ca2+-transporting ATPase